jgi:hypothetical protein
MTKTKKIKAVVVTFLVPSENAEKLTEDMQLAIAKVRGHHDTIINYTEREPTLEEAQDYFSDGGSF